LKFHVWEAKTKTERERAGRVTAGSFSNYYSTLNLFPHWIERYENWRSYVLSTENNDLAHIGVVRFRIRAGKAPLQCAGLAWVGTDSRFQKQGWGRRLMETILERLSKQEVPAAMLFGIPDYYHRFGFSACLPDYEQRAPSSLLLRLEAPHPVSSFKDKHTEGVQSVYTFHMKNRNASVIRTPKRWQCVLKRQSPTWVSKAPKTGRITGYLAWGRDGNRVVVHEAGCRDLQAASSLLKRLGKKAEEEKAYEVQLNLPPDDPFARLAFLEGADIRLHIHKNGGGMLGMIRSDKAVEALSSSFLHALANSQWRDKTFGFRVEGEQGGHTFRWRKGTLVRIPSEKPQHLLHLTSIGFVQALTGFSSMDELLGLGEASCRTSSLPLWRILFPQAYPYVCPADRF